MSSDDPYFDDENGVLFNKAGITDQDELTRFELTMSLERIELTMSLERIEQLRHDPIPGNFDEQHLNAIHEHILGDVYEFAGHSRLEKNWDPKKYEDVLDMQSVDYPKCFAVEPGEDLKSALDDAFGNLQGENNLQNLSQDQFIERLAEHTTAIWTAHNFREGNTRTTSEFVFQLAKEAGHELPPDFPAEKEEFRDALALASTGENERLISQITKAVGPIDWAELVIAALTEDLVSDELVNKSIDHVFESTSTAESKYIEKA